MTSSLYFLLNRQNGGCNKSFYFPFIKHSNDHLEGMLNTEIDSLKEFIKVKPSSASLTTGSATMEEELYDSKVIITDKSM